MRSTRKKHTLLASSQLRQNAAAINESSKSKLIFGMSLDEEAGKLKSGLSDDDAEQIEAASEPVVRL